MHCIRSCSACYAQIHAPKHSWAELTATSENGQGPAVEAIAYDLSLTWKHAFSTAFVNMSLGRGEAEHSVHCHVLGHRDMHMSLASILDEMLYRPQSLPHFLMTRLLLAPPFSTWVCGESHAMSLKAHEGKACSMKALNLSMQHSGASLHETSRGWIVQ